MAAISPLRVSVPESGLSWLAPLDWMLKKDMAGLGDPALLDIVRLLPQASQRLSISQMHVSRLRTHALGYLRSRLLDLEGTRANAGPALAPRPPVGHTSTTSANRL